MEAEAFPANSNDGYAFRMNQLLNYRHEQIASEKDRGVLNPYHAASLQLAAANMRHNHPAARAAHWH